MYIVYDPNHQVKLVTNGAAIVALVELRDCLLDGEHEDNVEWDKNIDHVKVYTHLGLYTIERTEIDHWMA